MGASCNSLLLLQPTPQNELHHIFFMQGITTASFLRAGTAEQQSTAIFHPALAGMMILDQRRNHSIAPQLETFCISWQVVDRDINLKVGKIILEKSLLPMGLPPMGTLNHVQVLTSGEAFRAQTLCSELVLGSSHARLFYLLV